MATSAIYIFTDAVADHLVYMHFDGYPQSVQGGFAAITAAGRLAFEPRSFEAGEFAAAFIAANKKSPGNIKLCNPGGGCVTRSWRDYWISYLYTIEKSESGIVWVKCFKVVDDELEQLYSSPLDDVLRGWYPKDEINAELAGPTDKA